MLYCITVVVVPLIVKPPVTVKSPANVALPLVFIVNLVSAASLMVKLPASSLNMLYVTPLPSDCPSDICAAESLALFIFTVPVNVPLNAPLNVPLKATAFVFDRIIIV